MIDTKLLTFIKLAETKSYTKTANLLNFTQPSVSQHIKVLENYYNTKLFSKSRRQIQLTEEGQILLKYALDMQRISKQAKEEIRNTNSKVRRYDIGATLTIGGYVLPEMIGRYRLFNENTDIIMQVENTESIMKKLFEGDICMGVIEGPFDRTKVNYLKFDDDELVYAVAYENEIEELEKISIEALLNQKLILREKGSGTRKIFENCIVKSGHSLEEMNLYMEVGDITALVSLVESNLGGTIISKRAIAKNLENKTLKMIEIENFKIMRQFNFVYLKNGYSIFIDDFIEFCLDYKNKE